jgi:hypothetical protein
VGYVACMETGEVDAKGWSININGGSHMGDIRDISIDWSTSASERLQLRD